MDSIFKGRIVFGVEASIFLIFPSGIIKRGLPRKFMINGAFGYPSACCGVVHPGPLEKSMQCGSKEEKLA
ncbi:MAG: hypothetical protein AAB307_06610, partial [Deltaproteobacteria bacterium]